MIETTETNYFQKMGGYRTHDFPTTHLGMKSAGERRCAAESFLRTLLGGEGRKVCWNLKDTPWHHSNDFAIEEVWDRLESMNWNTENVLFTPILGKKLTKSGGYSPIPPPFFAVDVDVIPSEFGGTPEEFMRCLPICQALEIPFTYCVSSNTRLTFYWVIDQEIPLYLWSAIQGHLTEVFSGDPTSLLPNKSRLLPGMVEWKEMWTERPHVLQSMTRPYRLEEFVAAFGMQIVSKSDLEVDYESITRGGI